MDPCLGGLYPGKEHPFLRQEERVANNPEKPQVGGVRGLSYRQAPTLSAAGDGLGDWKMPFETADKTTIRPG